MRANGFIFKSFVEKLYDVIVTETFKSEQVLHSVEVFVAPFKFQAVGIHTTLVFLTSEHRAVQQVVDFLIVYLEERHIYCNLPLLSRLFNFMDQHFGRPLNEPKLLFILLRWKLGYDNPFICLHIFVTLHCERFSGPGLAVCEHSRVVAFNHSFDHPRYPRLLKGLSLGAALP
jgi:hypothetical protein